MTKSRSPFERLRLALVRLRRVVSVELTKDARRAAKVLCRVIWGAPPTED